MSVRDFVPHWDIALLFAAFWLSNGEGGRFVKEWSRHHFGARIGEMLEGVFGLGEPPTFATMSPARSGGRPPLSRRSR